MQTVVLFAAIALLVGRFVFDNPAELAAWHCLLIGAALLVTPNALWVVKSTALTFRQIFRLRSVASRALDIDAHSTGLTAIFLRPFEFDGCYRMKDNVTRFGTSMNIELWIASRCMERNIAVVALGRQELAKATILGAGRPSQSPADWQNMVLLQLSRCAVLFIVPLDNPGTLWELENVASNFEFLKKTIVIMPPALARETRLDMRRVGYGDFQTQIAARWSRAREIIQEKTSVVLPQYDARGGFYKVVSSSGADPEFKLLFRLDDVNIEHWRRFLSEIMALAVSSHILNIVSRAGGVKS